MPEDSTKKNTSDVLLELVGVTKVFDDGPQLVEAVSDVSLKLRSRDFAILFGAATSGKTTLLAIMLGLMKPDIGEVLVKDEPLYELGENERAFLRSRKFGIIAQSQTFVRNLNVLNTVAFPLILTGMSEKEAVSRATQVLTDLEISDLAKKNPLKISYFDRSVVAIARALVLDPWIIFIDEPYLGLETKKAEKILSILKWINETKRTTIFMTTSDVKYLNYGSRWVFLNDGRILDIQKNNDSVEKLKSAVKIMENAQKEKEDKNYENLIYS